MDDTKFREFISKVGVDKARKAIKQAELTEEEAEALGITSKQKKADQVEYLGDMTPQDFFSQLRSAIAEILGKKKPEPINATDDGGKKKRSGKLADPDHKKGSIKKPGDQSPGGNSKPTAKGIDAGFMAFILPGLGKDRQAALRSKDGSKTNYLDLAQKVEDDLDPQERSPGENSVDSFMRWLGFDF